jgi:oligosaccharyltransferase complex subunit beta
VIEEFDGTTNSWKPYVADDVQLEFRMLHPYVRRNLTPVGNGTFITEFKLPDVYGVFKFTIDYRRDGYSHVQISEQVGVRPFRHNEFERFIASAFPYYASAFSMMGGFVLFSVVFLFTKETKEKRA